jgi:hypothetical protein
LQRTPYLYSVGAHLNILEKTAWFFKTLKELPGFIQRRMRDYLTNSNSPTIQPKLKELGIGF